MRGHSCSKSDGQPTVNRQSTLTSPYCQATFAPKNDHFLFNKYYIIYLYIIYIKHLIFIAQIDTASAINEIRSKTHF